MKRVATVLAVLASLFVAAHAYAEEPDLSRIEKEEKQREERLRVAKSEVWRDKFSCFFERDIWQPGGRAETPRCWRRLCFKGRKPVPVSHNGLLRAGAFDDITKWLGACYSDQNARPKRGKYPKTTAEWDEAEANWADFKKYAGDWEKMNWLSP